MADSLAQRQDDNTCYLKRSDVRAILVQGGNGMALHHVDALQIFTAADLVAPAEGRSDKPFPHKACRTYDECRREGICLDASNCSCQSPAGKEIQSSDGSQAADGAIGSRGVMGEPLKCDPSRLEGETTRPAEVATSPLETIAQQMEKWARDFSTDEDHDIFLSWAQVVRRHQAEFCSQPERDGK